jgi:ribosomal-protein-alanine N-acetyltransferase
MSFRIRERRPEDSGALEAIVNASPEAARWVDGYECMVAESETEVAGFVLFRVVAGEGELLNVAVAPEHRRCGVARGLWSAIEARAGLWHLEVRASNAAAIRFYEELGFTRVGEREGYYADGETATLYTRIPA